MRRQSVDLVAIVLFAISMVGTVALAQTGSGFDLSWHVIGGGGAGGPLTGSGFSLRSTVGQTAISTFTDATHRFGNGYWFGAVNTAPTLSGLPDVTIDETTTLPVTIDLWAYANDGETPVDELTYTLDSSPPVEAGVSIESNRWLTIQPSARWCTMHTDVAVRVTDPFELWDRDTFHLADTRPCRTYLPVVMHLAGP
jgi:hypothetical protein